MCEGMLGGMCAGVVCEDILFCTMSVLRSSNCTLDGVSGKERASTWRSSLLGHLSYCKYCYLHNIDLHHVATYYIYLKCVMLCEVQIVAAMAKGEGGIGKAWVACVRGGV